MNYFNKTFLYPHNIGFHYTSFEDFLLKVNINGKELQALSGISTRTLRRYINEDTAPQWVYLVAYCAAGYLLHEGWQGWRVHNQGIVHFAAPSCTHDSIKPSMLMDMGRYYERSRTQARTNDDLARENDLLRAKALIVDYKRLVPDNVKPINKQISYEHISKQITGNAHA